LGAGLAKNDIAEVNQWLINFKQRFLTRANQRNLDKTSLSQYGEEVIDVLVELGCESDCDRCGKTCTHSARGCVHNIEEVFDLILQGHQFETVEGEGDVRH
jgi:hypothetical protein